MSAIFADTSLLVAFINVKDEFHAAAAGFMLESERPVITTHWVLIELGNYLGKSSNRTAFAPFIEQLRADDRFLIVPALDEFFTKGTDLYDQRPDKQWSLTDCISFIVMDQHRIREAMTTDHHFEQAGFSILLK